MNGNLVRVGVLEDLKIHLTAIEERRAAFHAKTHGLAFPRIKDSGVTTTYFRIER